MLGKYKLFSLEYIERGLRRQLLDPGEEIVPGLLARGIDLVQVFAYLFLSIPCRMPIISQIAEFIAINWGRGVTGFFIRSIFWKTKLAECGMDCFIDRGVTIIDPKNVFLGHDIHLDENVSLIVAEGKIEIGNYVHIAGNSMLQGKGGIRIGEFAAISFGCTVYSASNVYAKLSGERVSCSAMAPYQKQEVEKSFVYIGKFSLLGTGSILLPGGSVGDYSIIGASSLVFTNIPEDSVAVGTPAKVIKRLGKMS